MDLCVSSNLEPLASPMARLCQRSHEIASQHDADNANDVNQRDLLSDLKELDALMHRFELKRCDLKRSINCQYSPIIQQLPPDVLTNVFSFCLPDHTNFYTSLSKFNLSAPLILGAICKDWREIAWSSPRLWSAMPLIISSSSPIFESQTSLAHQWLARSGRLSLSIRIVLEWDFDESNSTFPLENLVTVVNEQSSRWHTFHLSVPPKIYHFFHGLNLSTPILESLHFLYDKPQPFISERSKFFLPHCPRLQEIRITNVPLRWIKVPRDNITRVYADGLDIEECWKILQKCRSLVHCELKNIRYSHAEGEPVFTNLRHLTIQVGYGDVFSAAQFLDDLTAPCLETLNIEGKCVLTVPSAIASLRSLLSRSACSLHTFSMAEVRFEQDGLMALLEAMPTLKHLTVSAPSRSRIETAVILKVLDRVITSQGKRIRQGFLANLETLTYTGLGSCHPRKVPHAISLGPWIPDVTPQRALYSVTLNFYTSSQHLPKEAIPFLLGLKRYGITLKVCDASGVMEDPLQVTIDFYKSLSEVHWIEDLDWNLVETVAVQHGVDG